MGTLAKREILYDSGALGDNAKRIEEGKKNNDDVKLEGNRFHVEKNNNIHEYHTHHAPMHAMSKMPAICKP